MLVSGNYILATKRCDVDSIVQQTKFAETIVSERETIHIAQQYTDTRARTHTHTRTH